MTKILITYASYGNGHKAVADAICDYLQDKGYELKIIDILKYGNFFLKMDKKTFELNYKYQLNHHLFTIIYKISDNKIITAPYKELTKFLFNKKLIKEIIDYNPDILIASHFFGSILMGIIKKKYHLKGKIVTIITDYKAHTLWLRNNKQESAIIVGNNSIKEDLINYGIESNKIYPLGIPISKNFLNPKPNPNFKFANQNKTILFLGGGGKGSNFTFKYFKKLLEANLPINIIFIAGNNLELKEKCESYSQDKNIKVLGFTKEIPILLKNSDLVITKPGGIATTEAMTMHTPLILIPGNGGPEIDNANFIVNNKFGLNSKNPNELVQNIKMVLENPKLLATFKNNLTRHFENNALEKLFNLIKEMEKIK